MRRRFPDGRPAGVALVVTLMMMSVLTMMVVGLAGVMRNEQAAARNLTYLVLADQMAEIGAREAMAAVLSNSPTNGVPSATGPGWTLTNGTLVPLFSSNAAAPTVNLEAIGNNSLILSQTSAATTILAHWLNVGTNTNLPVGRYAWWVDDEGTKADLNAAAQRNTNLFPLTTAWPFTTRQIFGMNLNDFNNRTNFLHTTESVKEIPNIAMTRFHGAKGQATVWSRTLDLNPWGQPKVPLSRLTNPAVVTNDATFGALMAETFAHPQLTTLFGRDYVDKYGNGNRGLGSNVIRQTLANAHEALKFLTNTTSAPVQSTSTTLFAGTNLPTDFQGMRPSSLRLNEVVVLPTFNNVNTNQCQLQIWVWVEIANIGSTSASNDVFYWTGPTGNMTVAMTLSNGTTYRRNPTLSGFYKTNGSAATNAGGASSIVAARGFFTNRSWIVFAGNFETAGVPGLNAPAEWRSPSINDPAGTVASMQIENFQLSDIVSVEKIIVGGSARRPIYTNVVTDWVRGPFPPLNFNNVGLSAVNLSFINGGYSGSATEYGGTTAPSPVGNPSAAAFSRKDPRSRVFPGWETAGMAAQNGWQQAPPSFGADNSVLGGEGSLNGGLVQDRLATTVAVTEGSVWTPATNLFTTNTTNTPSWGVGGSNLPSVGILGSLHTGLNWRTLRMAGKGNDPDPPDWFLYEVFTAATNPVGVPAPRINVNNRILDAAGWGSAKAPMVLALLANLTNGTGTIPTNILALNPRWTTNDLNTVSNNLSVRPLPRVTGSTWENTRSGALGLADTSVILFSSELAEVDGLGNAGTSDQQAESVMTAAMDLLTTRSDTFTAWSAGQGLLVFTNALGQVRTNVMGEVRKQTVFQRVPQTNNAGAITGWQIKVLYTRNHVVE